MKRYYSLMPAILIILVSIIFTFPGVTEGQSDLPKEFQAGKYKVQIPDECREDSYEMVDVEPINAQNNEWRVICEPHDDEQVSFGILFLQSQISKKEKELGTSNSGSEKIKEKSQKDDNDVVEGSNKKVKEGGFLGWVSEATSKVKTFFEGEILCKNEELDQPERGTLNSFEGDGVDVYINRGLNSFPAREGMSLKGGDVIVAKEGASVNFSIGGNNFNLAEKNKFQVPRKKYECTRHKVTSTVTKAIGGVWQWAKEKVKGEPFDVKTPSGGGGVRG